MELSGLRQSRPFLYKPPQKTSIKPTQSLLKKISSCKHINNFSIDSMPCSKPTNAHENDYILNSL